MEWQLFEEVGDALRGMLPPDLGELRLRVRRYGIKVWFGPTDPPREHYEAQVIGADAVKDAKVLALEIGFHAEHSQVKDNTLVIAQLLEHEEQWRPVVGDAAVVGPFLGRAKSWRRVSETWPDPDLGDPELAIELAAQLADYITGLEPAAYPVRSRDVMVWVAAAAFAVLGVCLLGFGIVAFAHGSDTQDRADEAARARTSIEARSRAAEREADSPIGRAEKVATAVSASVEAGDTVASTTAEASDLLSRAVGLANAGNPEAARQLYAGEGVTKIRQLNDELARAVAAITAAQQAVDELRERAP